MTDKKIDISSTTIEKGLDIAKNFLDKLVIPTVEETGLLLKDKVTMWRFKNQIRMLTKAKVYCDKNKINPKQISLKVLCPLLDYSGLEEDEVLHDKWAILLSNMVDSDQNIENHVFPYILSQVSSKEFLVIEKVFDEKLMRCEKLNKALEEFRTTRPKAEEDIKIGIEEIDRKITTIKKAVGNYFNEEVWDLQKERRAIEGQLITLKHYESNVMYSIRKPESIPNNSLKDFELSNLIRLGLVKEEKEFYANSQTLEIPSGGEYERHVNVDLNVDVESSIDNILTELGELFISACKEKIRK